MILKTINILSAFVVLFSSTGFVLNKHYCQNQLKSVAIFIKAENCHSASKTVSCPFHKNMEAKEKKKKNCCNDDSEYIKDDKDQQVQLNDFDFSDKVLLKVFLSSSIFEEKKHIYQHVSNYLSYKPPIFASDILVLFQTFLI